ncbi:GNAT family N-acetyltransferase [uncultured Alsobacter sp.]|uniref:GNAT family N-acetyltransferase n=1 Tax=uncultured Alsobacter sp. TaxID=1748258 RepID=UPI0025F759B0|nr:GNAT family N-acetyltransferase [uncultured Alsobacter sp.]
MSVTVASYASIEAIGRERWDRCFPGEAEGYAFYVAAEEAGPPGFHARYIVALDGEAVLAAAPAFLTRYRLDTTVQGPLKPIAEALTRTFPRLLTLDLAAIGSPVAEICHLGFAPEVGVADRPSLVVALLEGLERLAEAEGCGLVAVKDAAEKDIALWRTALEPRGFQAMPGLPTGLLSVPPGGLDGYFATLSRATRKDLKRKWKQRERLRVEHRTNVDDVLDRIASLYAETVAHSDLQFEHLPPAYFAAVLRRLAPSARVVLYWAGDDLVAFNLLIETGDRLVDKYIGMHYPVVGEYSLYYTSWLENVAWCSRQGIPLYQAGQGFYGPKVRLGCRLSPNWLYFRHRNRWINAVLKTVSRIVSLDRFDPEIARLMDQHARKAA